MEEGPATRWLVLLRHAKSAWPEGVPDHDRPLAGRGLRDAPAAGRWLRQADIVPDYVLCSTSARTRQTWALASRELRSEPPVTYDRRVYEASAGGLLDVVHEAPPAARTLVVVGHSPGVPDLALALAGEDVDAALLYRIRAKFPTAAIAVVEVSGSWSGLAPGRARLVSFVSPHEMTQQR